MIITQVDAFEALNCMTEIPIMQNNRKPHNVYYAKS